MTFTPVDPFASYTKQYNPKNLLWASSTRGDLKLNPPPFQLTLDADGTTIHVSEVVTKFQQNTGIQEGFQLLQLQGKDVSEYPGGIDEIRKVVQENRSLQVIALKPSSGTEEIAEKAPPKPRRSSKNRKAVLESLSIAFEEPSSGTEEIGKKEKSSKATNHTEEKKKRRKRRSTANHPVKLASTPKEEDKKHHETASTDFAALQKKYNKRDLLWASSTKLSVQQTAPFRLTQYPSGAIRIVQVESQFQEATGVKAGQRVVQLQGKDIAAYGDFDEIQKVIQESLELDLIVLKRKSERKQKHPSETTRSETTTNSPSSIAKSSSSSKISPDEKSASKKSPSSSLSKKRDWLKSKLIRRVSAE
mmetsp:Transcript_10708/g.25900  ORF Transcript_10708/g.25900 Transcript_10708/m.25900 type:complete len:361 (+) Transcript_10708:355-1437(+)